MAKNDKFWDQELFSNKKSKVTVLTIIGVVLLALAILAWANATGKIKIFGDTLINPKCVTGNTNGSTLCVTTTCRSADNHQLDKVVFNGLFDLKCSGSSVSSCAGLTLEYYKNGKWEISSDNGTITNSNHTVTFNVDAGTDKGRKYRVVLYKLLTPALCNANSTPDSCRQILGEVSATACSGAATATPTTTAATTPSAGSFILNPVAATCPSDWTSGKQQNILSWTNVTPSGNNTMRYSGYVKSSLTNNQYVAAGFTGDESSSRYEHPYLSVDGIAYKIGTNTGLWTNEQAAENKHCAAQTSSPTPTSTGTATSTPTTGQFSLTYTSGTCETNGQRDTVNWTAYSGANQYKISGTLKDGTAITSTKDSSTLTWSEVINKDYVPVSYKIEALGSGGNVLATSNTITGENKTCGQTITPTATTTTTVTPTATPTTPIAPTNLTATSPSNSTIKLTWTASTSPNVAYYRVYNATTKQLIGQVDSSTKTYLLEGLVCETGYSYYVTANYESLESSPSNTASATTGKCVSGSDITDKKPGNIQAVYNGGGMVTLTWDKVDGATGYDIYNCSGTYITSSANNSNVFTGVSCGTEVCYYVVAHDSAGKKSKNSDQAKASSNACDAGKIVKPNTDSLVSTGGALWFNIALALILTGAITYLMFRREIWSKNQPNNQMK